MANKPHDSNPASSQPEMTKDEKEKLFEQVEESEGPDRREIRGDNTEPAKDPGVAHS
jgi:hypothetical protein